MRISLFAKKYEFAYLPILQIKLIYNDSKKYIYVETQIPQNFIDEGNESRYILLLLALANKLS